MSHWSKDAIIERAEDEVIEMDYKELMTLISEKGNRNQKRDADDLYSRIVDIGCDVMVEELMNQSP